MPTIDSVMADVMFLTDYQKEILANRIFEMLSLSPVTIKECREARFAMGKSVRIVKVTLFLNLVKLTLNNAISVSHALKHSLT